MEYLAEVTVCVSGIMFEKGEILLGLVCVSQEVLLTESGWRLLKKRLSEREMEQLEGGSLHAQLKEGSLLGRCHKEDSH